MSVNPIISGVAVTEFGSLPNETCMSLHVKAALGAIQDAGINAHEVDAIICAFSIAEPHPMLASALAEAIGVKPKFCHSVQAGGATGAIMTMLASELASTGRYRHVLLVTGDNRLTGLGRDGAVQALAGFGHPVHERPYGFSIPAAYALVAQRYSYEYRLLPEQLAAVAVSARTHALRHPLAQMKTPITIDDVCNSRIISSPLRLLDCCLISDGAAAVIVSSGDVSRDLPDRAVEILGSGQGHTHEHIVKSATLTKFGCAQSSRRAFGMAGLGPKDIDVAEIYDSFTITLIVELESIGFFELGEAGEAVLNGALDLGGRLPCNTHGGLMSFGHSGAAGGMCHVVEAVEQLRGKTGSRQVEGAETAFVHGDGGVLSAHCSLVLGVA